MTSALAPLGVRVFRLLWIAGLVSNIGSWMQTVGAQWLLVEHGSPASVVALVQTAAAAPVLLLALPAGVLGEFFNRRTLLIVVQAAQFVIVLGLAALTWAGATTPAVLLALTFLLGACSAVQLPAYQAVVPEVVPSPMIADAAVLSSVGVNVARAIGPALAGLVVAQLGVTAVFLANALSFLVFLVALIAWRGYAPKRGRPERFLDATRAGLRYVRNARAIRGLYLRLALFLLPANGLWALLPVFASSGLHLDAGGYGLLLAALGVGSIAGAFLLPPLRARFSTGTVVAASSALFGVCSLALALLSALWLVLLVLVLAGFAWIGVIATINGTVQSFLPVWVRTRGLSIYQLVLFGSTAVGAAATGALAVWAGVVPVLLGCGVLLVVLGIVGALRPAIDTRDKGRAIVTMPLTDVPLVQGESPDDTADDTADRPVLVLIRYAVPPERRPEFESRMRFVGRSRRRTGARDWRLYADREDPAVLVEAFQVGSWSEHLSQHEERMTEYDRELLDGARALADGEPEVEHLLEAETTRRLRTEG
ncbi:MFS transporter [Leifsonia shinshuensis]|uniref:MFS family permease n=1 Tax=Leifsonia shinshuensis TaxID=150026 RepID=A0A853CZ60_9MICO|nr:MFS transporter [Leifsonia shinshuensis]NYJ25877.1 MFS family permease [Leifsonia shinshuensis]